MIFFTDNATTLHLGDAYDVLAAMPDQSADCIVTSPPYWANRDYGMPGQYGLEASPAAYVETLRSAFREAWRVLADDGTCWLNLGDCYSEGRTTPAGLHGYPGRGPISGRGPAVAAKNLLGLPWRVAFALQDDGWILRNAIVWHKPNAMPQSVRDRMSNRYELIFLLAKSRHYWFDLDPIRVPHARHTPVSPCTASTGSGGTRRPGGIPATGRHPGNGEPSGTHPGSGRPGGTRPGNRRPKYGAHTGRSSERTATPTGAAIPTGETPATCGQSRPAPSEGRTSPPSPSTCQHTASWLAVSLVARCSIRSAVPAPPALPPSPSAGGSPVSNSTRRLPLDSAAALAASGQIEDASLKMARYRAALDAGGDPGEIGKWIAEAKAQRLQAESELHQATSKTTLNREQITELIEQCADIAADLRDAEPSDMASTYQKLGLRLTYHPGRQLVSAEACPKPRDIGKWFVSEGGLEPPCP